MNSYIIIPKGYKRWAKRFSNCATSEEAIAMFWRAKNIENYDIIGIEYRDETQSIHCWKKKK